MHLSPRRPNAGQTLTAEEIVANKVAQFTRKRRELVWAIAKRSNKEVPPEIERFFETLEAGQWDEIKKQFHELAVHSGQYKYSKDTWEQLSNSFWPAVVDAYGVAEQAHDWPAQKLLDYGNAVLGSLPPGAVYVGGTDPGRWIPALINETADGEQHIMMTQNALADRRYLDFVNEVYSDRMQTLSKEDSQRAFQEYTADAQRRLEHDQQFPDEPKQIRPGEDVKVVDGKVQFSGQVAVISINEKLLAALMQKNPDMSFAIEESFPLTGTYADAMPLGPLMQLNARNDQNPFTADSATQSVDYWRNTTQQLLSDAEASGSDDVLQAYSHDAVAAANLLAAHNFSEQAEGEYRLAAQLWPASVASVGGLAKLLAASGKAGEAQQLINNFVQKYPDQQKELDQFTAGGKAASGTTPKQ